MELDVDTVIAKALRELQRADAGVKEIAQVVSELFSVEDLKKFHQAIGGCIGSRQSAEILSELSKKVYFAKDAEDKKEFLKNLNEGQPLDKPIYHISAIHAHRSNILHDSYRDFSIEKLSQNKRFLLGLKEAIQNRKHEKFIVAKQPWGGVTLYGVKRETPRQMKKRREKEQEEMKLLEELKAKYG